MSETEHQRTQREARERKRAKALERDAQMRDATWRMSWRRHSVANDELLSALRDAGLIGEGILVSRGWDAEQLHLTLAPDKNDLQRQDV